MRRGRAKSRLNEVVYGLYPGPTRFARLLNDHLLVPKLDLAHELVAERTVLAAKGADLEVVPQMDIVEILIRDADPK